MVLNYLFSWAQQYTGKDFIFWMTTHHTSSSISIFSIGYVLTGLALDSHFAVVVLTLGVCHGVGFSLTYAQAIGAVMKVEKRVWRSRTWNLRSVQWFPGDQGFMTSFAVAGYGFGGVLWNPLETAFVNPENVEVQGVGEGEDK